MPPCTALWKQYKKMELVCFKEPKQCIQPNDFVGKESSRHFQSL